MLDINVNVPVCYAVADAPTKFLYWPTTTTYILPEPGACFDGDGGCRETAYLLRKGAFSPDGN